MRISQRPTLIADGIAIASFFLIVLTFFYKSVLGQGVIGSFDLVVLFHPYKDLIRHFVSQGELPLWNPYLYLGVPLLANVQTGVLYPPGWLFLILPFPAALTWTTVLHLWWGLTGTFLFLRHGLRTSAFAAWVGALSFGLGGFLLPHIGHMNQVYTAVWLPWLLLCARHAAGKTGIPALALGGVVTAFAFTAGHTQEFYYSFLALALFCGFMCVVPVPGQPTRWWPLVVPAAFGVSGGLLAAIQLLPTLEATLQSYRRDGVPLHEAAELALNRNEVLLSLLPNYWQPPSVETSGYLAVSCAVLAFLGLSHITDRRWVLFFVSLATVAFILALGTYTPLFALLYKVLPGFAAFRVAGRWMFLVSFSLSVLAAIGADYLRDDLPPAQRRRASFFFILATLLAVLFVFVFLARTYLVRSHQALPEANVVALWAMIALLTYALILLALSHGVSSAVSSFLLGAIIVAELFAASRPLEFNQVMPETIYRPAPSSERLADLWQDARYISIAGERFPLENEEQVRADLSQRLRNFWVGLALQYSKYGEELRPNRNMPLFLKSADGYDGGLLPTAAYAQLRAALFNNPDVPPHFGLPLVGNTADATLWGLLNVRYLVADHHQRDPGPGWQLLGQVRPDGPLLFENTRVLPRAFVVYEVMVGDDPLLLRGIDVSRQALVERTIPELVGTTGAAHLATITADEPQRVEVRFSAEKTGLLVLSDAYYPGWRAYLDGEPAELLRVNIALRGVVVPPGEHTVVFAYHPRWFQVGAVLSLVTLLGLILLFVAHLQPRK